MEWCVMCDEFVDCDHPKLVQPWCMRVYDGGEYCGRRHELFYEEVFGKWYCPGHAGALAMPADMFTALESEAARRKLRIVA